jgi:hypothetical protein
MDSFLFVQLFFWDFVGIFKNYLDHFGSGDVPKSEKLQHPSSSIQVGLYYRYGIFLSFEMETPGWKNGIGGHSNQQRIMEAKMILYHPLSTSTKPHPIAMRRQ